MHFGFSGENRQHEPDGNAIYEINAMKTLAARDQWMNRVHPLVKFILPIGYIVVAVSFPKYDLIGLLGMAVYLIAGFLLAELSFGKCLRRQDLVYLFIWCVLFAVLRKVPVILWVGRTHRGKWKCLILWKM